MYLHCTVVIGQAILTQFKIIYETVKHLFDAIK